MLALDAKYNEIEARQIKKTQDSASQGRQELHQSVFGGDGASGGAIPMSEWDKIGLFNTVEE